MKHETIPIHVELPKCKSAWKAFGTLLEAETVTLHQAMQQKKKRDSNHKYRSKPNSAR